MYKLSLNDSAEYSTNDSILRDHAEAMSARLGATLTWRDGSRRIGIITVDEVGFSVPIEIEEITLEEFIATRVVDA